MDANPDDRDQQLLEHLAAIERLAQRDQAIRWLAQTLKAELQSGCGTPTAPATAPVQLVGTSANYQSVAPILPPAQPGMPLNGDALVASPPLQQTLAEHPLVSHLVTFLPLDWQMSVAPVLGRVHFSVRTFAVLVVLVLCVGFYTGHVTVPPWVRDYVHTCPQPQVQPQGN